MITVVDYGVGNFLSVKNMLRLAGFDCQLTADADRVGEAEKIILPGVGAFDAAMEKLVSLNLADVLKRKATEGTPILGICLGAQLLTKKSEEGEREGLSLLPAACKKFQSS